MWRAPAHLMAPDAPDGRRCRRQIARRQEPMASHFEQIAGSLRRRMAERGARVLLTGCGGDHAFAGSLFHYADSAAGGPDRRGGAPDARRREPRGFRVDAAAGDRRGRAAARAAAVQAPDRPRRPTSRLAGPRARLDRRAVRGDAPISRRASIRRRPRAGPPASAARPSPTGSRRPRCTSPSRRPSASRPNSSWRSVIRSSIAASSSSPSRCPSRSGGAATRRRSSSGTRSRRCCRRRCAPVGTRRTSARRRFTCSRRSAGGGSWTISASASSVGSISGT